jgi:hypothetical protein
LVRGPSENRPVNYEIYVAAGGEALVVLQGDIVLSSTFLGVYETPGTATLNQIVDQAMAVIRGDSSGRSEKVVRTMVQCFFDRFIIGLGGLILWLAFFAQFTLPVSGIQERVTSIDRLMSFLMGRHGPALHVREGKVIWGA